MKWCWCGWWKGLCVRCCMVMLCDGVWNVVCDGVIGGKCCGKVKWMNLCCLGVLLTDWQTDGHLYFLSRFRDWKMCENGSHTVHIENLWGGRGSSKYYHGYIDGGWGYKSPKNVLRSMWLIPYFFSRYPLETTKLWNLTNLLTPASWFAYFLTIIIVIFCLKICCYFGRKLGLNTIREEIALVPFRFLL